MRKKLAELINVIFGFRKFILMLVLYVVGIVFRVLDLINGAEMVDLFKNTTIAFFGANGVEHLLQTVKGYMSKKAGETEEVVPADEGSEQTQAEAADNAQSQGAKP